MHEKRTARILRGCLLYGVILLYAIGAIVERPSVIEALELGAILVSPLTASGCLCRVVPRSRSARRNADALRRCCCRDCGKLHPQASNDA